MEEKLFCPFRFFDGTLTSNYAILILNYSTETVRKILRKDLWSRATIRCCADGGANVLKKFSDETNEDFLPDFISGDFDSIDPTTRQYYENQRSVKFVETIDQSATDFTKSVRSIVKQSSKKIDEIFVFASLAGRFDHSAGNIHSLFLFNQELRDVDVFLLTEIDLVFLLQPNRINSIEIKSDYRADFCSLLPFLSSTHVRTEGLKWNLTEQTELAFDKCVSSSNGFLENRSENVRITTDKPLIWTMTHSFKS